MDSASHVLDVATGTGIWADDFAKAHPAAVVIGTELTEPAPVSTRNCTLVAADAEAEAWPFPHKFDYIHLRMTISCFNSRPKVFANCFANLKPGGWIELQDTDFTILSDNGSSRGTALETWCHDMVKGAKVIGRNLNDTRDYARMLREAGFVDIVEEQVRVPWSEWSSDPKLKELGRLQALNSRKGGQGVSAKILAAVGYKEAEISDLLGRVREDLSNTDIHAYSPLYVVYGRKPLS